MARDSEKWRQKEAIVCQKCVSGFRPGTVAGCSGTSPKSGVGTGFSEKLLADLYAGMRKLKRPSCPFVNLPEKKAGRRSQGIMPAIIKRRHWVEPVLVAQVKFTEWTHDDQLRQPVFLGLRTDKQARDAVRE
jgi:bifunctional non-homologous end joining protein LigD